MLTFSRPIIIAYKPVCEVAAVISSSELATNLVAIFLLVPDTTMQCMQCM